jgi:thiamine-phosphate pyrophosphorylase
MPRPPRPWAISSIDGEHGSPAAGDARLSIITDDALAPEALSRIVESACAQARLVVQLRARDALGGRALALARRLREVTAAAGCLLVVNDRIDVALAADADGVHLPAAGMASERARRLLGPRRLVGRSVHSFEEIERERALGAADYLQFGPVFATPSKAAWGEPQGLARLSRAAQLARPLAVVAVGGIGVSNAAQVMAAGAGGVAVIGAVMHAADPAKATVELIGELKAGGRGVS